MASEKTTRAASATQGAPTDATQDDALARNRTVAHLRAETIATLPAGYRAVDIKERRQRLARVNDDDVAELVAALRELHARRAHVPADLGDMAPDVSRSGDLVARIEGLDATINALEAQLEAHRQLRELALSDADNVVRAAHGEYAHRVDRKPEIVRHYPSTVRYAAAHGRAVAEGISRARDSEVRVTAAEARARAEAAAPAEAPAATPEATAPDATPRPARKPAPEPKKKAPR